MDKEIDTLCEHIEEQEKIANKFQIEAKTYLKNKDKKGAQQALIKKIRCEKQINYFEESLDLLEQQKMILGNLMMMKKFFKTVKETNETINETMKIKDFENKKNSVNEINGNIQNLNEDAFEVDDNLEQKNKKKEIDLPEANNKLVDKEKEEFKKKIEEEFEIL